MRNYQVGRGTCTSKTAREECEEPQTKPPKTKAEVISDLIDTLTKQKQDLTLSIIRLQREVNKSQDDLNTLKKKFTTFGSQTPELDASFQLQLDSIRLASEQLDEYIKQKKDLENNIAKFKQELKDQKKIDADTREEARQQRHEQATKERQDARKEAIDKREEASKLATDRRSIEAMKKATRIIDDINKSNQGSKGSKSSMGGRKRTRRNRTRRNRTRRNRTRRNRTRR